LNFFKTTGKLKIFQPEKSHHFVDPDALIFKIYTLSESETVFHKIIEENFIRMCVEITHNSSA